MGRRTRCDQRDYFGRERMPALSIWDRLYHPFVLMTQSVQRSLSSYVRSVDQLLHIRTGELAVMVESILKHVDDCLLKHDDLCL